jgi:hypothetical protein
LPFKGFPTIKLFPLEEVVWLAAAAALHSEWGTKPRNFKSLEREDEAGWAVD